MSTSLPRANIFDVVNERISAFVREPSNQRLLPGTGSYSALFRGSLFGLAESAAVAERLTTRGVDVLWLGTNPCVPQSLEYIINPPKGRGDFPDFERQMESGLFSSRRWNGHGQPSPDWSPIERPTHKWEVYRNVLVAVGARLDHVAMANFIPWGSQNIRDLVKELGAANRPLLERALAFADDVNAEFVQALAPKLVVVPFSLGKEPKLDAVRPGTLTLARATDRQNHTVPLRRKFNFHTGSCQRGSLTVRTVFLPHPDSLRLSREEKPRVVEEVVKVLAKL